jgi:catechol 2,3-dioxygenase-like lactoylglutathione lyase family enzyme
MPIFSMTQMDARISELVARLTVLERERAEIVAEIDALRSAHDAGTGAVKVVPSGRADDPTDRNSPIEKKIALFRRLFRGRSDVFPIRWENRTTGRSGYAPACGNEWQPGICGKPKVKCSACPNQAFLAVDEALIERHLRGTDVNGAPFVMGVYPMLADNTCSFLAADFDEEEWRRDAFAFRNSCERHGIPVAIERSRSGNGAHATARVQGRVYRSDKTTDPSHNVLFGARIPDSMRRAKGLPDDAGTDGVGYGFDYPVFWIDRYHPHSVKQHTAFAANTRAEVDAFHAAALKAGGAENGAPGLRKPNCYAAFVLDPDGNNIEAVFRGD